MDTKQFIRTVYINELGRMINSFPYISFIVIGIGIELLGKCIDKELSTWDTPHKSKHYFELAICKLDSLEKYRPLLNSHNLYQSFRCGLAHSSKPDYAITLSSKNELGHLVHFKDRVNLKIEDFYSDFKSACTEVISDDYSSDNKMNLPFLSVPSKAI